MAKSKRRIEETQSIGRYSRKNEERKMKRRQLKDKNINLFWQMLTKTSHWDLHKFLRRRESTTEPAFPQVDIFTIKATSTNGALNKITHRKISRSNPHRKF